MADFVQAAQHFHQAESVVRYTPTATSAIVLVISMLTTFLVHAQQKMAAPKSPNQQAEPTTMGTVLVSGTVPGPGLWKVAKGEHVLYLLGTISPLPTDMHWNAAEVDQILAQSGEVIAPGRVEAKIGPGAMLKMASLMRSAFAATRVPKGQTLQSLLPGPVFSRWSVLKEKYLPNDQKVERLRPILASQELYSGAIPASGMTSSDVIWEYVSDAAKRHGVPIAEVKVSYPLAIDRSKYKAGINALSGSTAEELTCFTKTVDTLESDLEVMKQTANAWATGDPSLLQLRGEDGKQPACKAEYDRLMSFQRHPELAAQVRASWLATAQTALDQYRVTLSVLPMADMFGSDGILAKLRAMGYQVSPSDDTKSDEPTTPDDA